MRRNFICFLLIRRVGLHRLICWRHAVGLSNNDERAKLQLIRQLVMFLPELVFQNNLTNCVNHQITFCSKLSLILIIMLYLLLPPPKNTGYKLSLRKCSHGLVLPTVHSRPSLLRPDVATKFSAVNPPGAINIRCLSWKIGDFRPISGYIGKDTNYAHGYCWKVIGMCHCDDLEWHF